MKKIIFIELLHHHECLENPYLIFKKKWYKTKAILWEFVAKKIKNISSFEEEFYVLNQPNRKLFSSFSFFWKIKYSISEFIEIYKNTKEIRKIISKEKPDYIYINTIESPFLVPLMIYLLWLKNIKMYLAIHNTNRLKVWFLKYFLYDFLIKRLINKSYKIILLWKYLNFSDSITQEKVIYLNNRIPQKEKISKFEKITFVMSWNLDFTVKDIETVLQWFWKVLNKNKNHRDKIQLVLLWQINNTVEKWIKEYKLDWLVKTFNEYVGEDDMEKYMWWAHYSIISTYKDSIYWKYKITWAFWDAVAFNLPIILSNNYAPDYENNNIIRFGNNLDTILEKIILKHAEI